MNLGSVPIIPAGDTFLNSVTNPGGKPGMQAWSRDGRRFRLVKNSAAAPVGAGNVMQGPATIPAHLAMTPTADVPVGSKAIRVTAGAAAAPANTYAGGLVFMNNTVSYAVKGHDAIVSGQPFTILLESDDPTWILIAAATDKVSLVANPYLEVVVSLGTASTAGPIGLTVGTGLAAGQWGFVQVEGLAIGRTDGAVAIGQALSPSVTGGGQLTINATTLPIVGSAVSAVAAAAPIAVSLNLP